MAFTHSLRTGVMPTLSVDGTFAAQTIRYLDSMDLQHQLHLLNIHSHAGAYLTHSPLQKSLRSHRHVGW